MDTGTKVFQANVYLDPADTSRPYYINEGEVTAILVDGIPMVRFHTMLLPLSEAGREWRATEAEAKADAVRELVRRIGMLQAVVDSIRDEMLHDSLTTEEVAA